MRFLLYLLTFFLIACSNEESMIKNFIQDNNLPFEEMKEVSLLETHNGKKKIELFAKQINRYLNSDIEIFLKDSVHVIFYNDSSKVISVLTSDNAVPPVCTCTPLICIVAEPVTVVPDATETTGNVKCHALEPKCTQVLLEDFL